MKVFLGRIAQRSGFLRRFADADDGNVAIVLGLSLVVLMLSIGGAIDIGRWLHARNQTITAVDAAVLAGGRALQVNSSDKAGAVAAAQNYYAQNVTSRLPVVNDTISFAVASDGMGLTASGSAYIKTPFLRFAKIEQLPLIGTAQTQFAKSQIAVGGNGGQSIEVSLILDITGSMAGSKISDLKDAAKDLVNIVISTPPRWRSSPIRSASTSEAPSQRRRAARPLLAPRPRPDIRSTRSRTRRMAPTRRSRSATA